MGWSDYFDENELKLSNSKGIFRALSLAIQERYIAIGGESVYAYPDNTLGLSGSTAVPYIENQVNRLALHYSSGTFFSTVPLDSADISLYNRYYPAKLFNEIGAPVERQLQYNGMQEWNAGYGYMYNSSFNTQFVRYQDKIYALGNRYFNSQDNINKPPADYPDYWYEVKDRLFKNRLSDGWVKCCMAALNKLCYPANHITFSGNPGETIYCYPTYGTVLYPGNYYITMAVSFRGEGGSPLPPVLVYNDELVTVSASEQYPYRYFLFPSTYPAELIFDAHARFGKIEFISGS